MTMSRETIPLALGVQEPFKEVSPNNVHSVLFLHIDVVALFIPEPVLEQREIPETSHPLAGVRTGSWKAQDLLWRKVKIGADWAIRFAHCNFRVLLEF